MDDIILTDNGRVVIGFLQTHDRIFIGKDIAEQTGVKGIYLVLNSLIKKSLVTTSEPILRDFTNSHGETQPKEYKTYILTDLGRNYKL